MRIRVSGKNIEVTNALKERVEKKLSKFEKYFNPDTEANATLTVEKNRHIIEVTIPFNGVILRGEEATEDMYSSIDNVVEKLESQIAKYRTKLERKIKDGSVRFENFSFNQEEDDDDEPKIVKTKRFAMKPMPVEEAVLQMELLGHSFFMFHNAESDEVNVVYKRKDGDYGLIEPEF
ncbi:ribosome hibernation-promoting factor, HPF/YfiA family [Lutispora saccharofermentans]|uniref:Ribosome hibernation promoting factor n=1 Tax=Lutispora saccharofermentans TaxID=3024236 RepID=A0ABT1NFK3_9FIRM|nr:ribosome-associated translation inhibitor RaiA [Lutispora saccharofermentans]MCQ1528631.1 ribosome-associated translation inhibitor RaiA [Lutispora saccharofermentans]